MPVTSSTSFVMRIIRAAEAVLLPDTALHTAALVEEAEELAGKKVLTSNQVTMWGAVDLTLWSGTAPRLGSIVPPSSLSHSASVPNHRRKSRHPGDERS